MFRALAVSLTKGNFEKFTCSQGSCDGDWFIAPEVSERLDGWGSVFAEIYGDTMDGVASPDDTFETNLDGTYDKFGKVIVHWREDGFIDFIAFDSDEAAEKDWNGIVEIYGKMPNGKTV